MNEKDVARFWSKVNKDGQVHPNLGTKCWEWTAGKHPFGYGNFWQNGKNRLTHRVSFETFVVGAPTKDSICHRCDNPSCVRPDHLFAGTQAENIEDKVRKGRQAIGTRIGKAVLNPDSVRKIRALSAEGLSSRKIAAFIGVSKTTVKDVLSGKFWRHVD